MDRPVTALVIGAGKRGNTYSSYSQDAPDALQIVGIAESKKFRRDKFAKTYNLNSEHVYNDWTEAASKKKFADCVFICVLDHLHKEPAIAFAKLGYHIFLEKPMAVTYEDCAEIVQVCKESEVFLTVGHVLRYAPQAQTIQKLISDGAIGDVVNIQLLEPVGFYHFAHSYVRGNWRNEKESAFSLLTKSCHDLDLIVSWMHGKRCTKISSFGSLKHFTKANKPEGASSRCTDCSVEQTCPYSAKRIYLDDVRLGFGSWASVFVDVPDIENVMDALRVSPYGRCVYDCDNDVCDNQVVNMEFEDGTTASFTMVAFTEKLCARQVRIFGTKGELTCDFGSPFVHQFDFLHQDKIVHDLRKESAQSSKSRLRGHFGADFFTVTSFLEAVKTNDRSKILTGPEESLLSHYLCFMAEKARKENRVIDLKT